MRKSLRCRGRFPARATPNSRLEIDYGLPATVIAPTDHMGMGLDVQVDDIQDHEARIGLKRISSHHAKAEAMRDRLANALAAAHDQRTSDGETRRRKTALESLPRSRTVLPKDELSAVKIFHTQPQPPGQFVAGRREDNEPLPSHRPAVDPLIDDRAQNYSYVILQVQNPREDRRRVGHCDRHAHLRPPLSENAEDGREIIRSHRSDPQQSEVAAPRALKQFDSRRLVTVRRVSRLVQTTTELAEHDAPAAPLEEFDAKSALEAGDVGRNRRLAESKPAGRR